MYGIEFKNKNNSLIIAGDERPLQYWGKKVITFTSNQTKVPLFNLPSTVRCSFYTVVTSGGGSNYHYLEAVNGKWNLCTRKNITHTVEVYVFTDPKLMPKPDYGLEVYDAIGVPIFRGNRPLLSVFKIDECYTDPSGNSNAYSPLITESSKIAINPFLVWRKSLPEGIGVFQLFDFYTTCYKDGVTYKHGIYMDIVTHIKAHVSYGTALKMNYPVIDATYYDQFSNLSDFS